MSGNSASGIEYDHEVVVDSVNEITSVPIECPGCGESFREALSDKLGGTTCHECNDWIRYVRRSELRDRGESTEDQTEQTRLVTDGGCTLQPGKERRQSQDSTRNKGGDTPDAE